MILSGYELTFASLRSGYLNEDSFDAANTGRARLFFGNLKAFAAFG